MKAQFILLADDDVDDQIFFQDAIDEIGKNIRTRTVYSGEQLMRMLTKENAVLPDLIFLDLNMPIMNGYQCLKEIRINDKLKHIPIAIFSTSSNQDDIDKTMQAGANIYVCKPNNFNKLKEVVALVVEMEWRYPFTLPSKEIFLINS